MEEDNYDVNGDNGQDFHFNWNGDDRGNSSNQELNVNNSQNQSFGNNNMSNSNTFSHYNNQNRMPSTSGLQNNRGLSSGQKDNNKNNNEDSSIGSSLKGNKNDRPFSDETNNNNKSSDSSTNNDSNKNDNKDNKDNKSNDDSSNNAENDNKSKGLGIKRRLGNAALGGLKKGANTINNLGTDGTENINPDDSINDIKDFGRNSVNAAVGIVSFIKNFIIKFPWLAIIIGVLLLGLFLLALLLISLSGSFGGIVYAEWHCNMYSPTRSNNPGEVTSFYGWRIWNGIEDDHKGIDLSYGEKGAEILATHDGIIKDTNYTSADATGEPFGVFILIEDPKETDEEKKYRSYYAHMCSLEEEKKLRDACLAGEYDRTCDSNCKETEDEAGNKTYEYIWSCGKSESDFENLISRLQPGMEVKKNDVIGYVSDTGTRSASCDFHFHYETLEDNLNDDPDSGFIAISPNRFFTLENSTSGCDPILSVGVNAPTYNQIIKWNCMEPEIINHKEEEMFNYCDEDDPITPETYRFKGTIKNGGEYIFEEGLGTYVGEICGYESKPTLMGTAAQCPSAVRDYFGSFLPDANPEVWKKLQGIMGHGKSYWINNQNDGPDGFKTSNTPKPGSIISLTGGTYGHVMVVTKVEGDTVYVYECNGDGGLQSGNITERTKCGIYTHTKSYLDNWIARDGGGYIHIIEEGENC